MKPFLDLYNMLRTLLSVALWLGKIRSKWSIPPFHKTSWSKLLYDHYYLLNQKPKQTGSELQFWGFGSTLYYYMWTLVKRYMYYKFWGSFSIQVIKQFDIIRKLNNPTQSQEHKYVPHYLYYLHDQCIWWFPCLEQCFSTTFYQLTCASLWSMLYTHYTISHSFMWC